MYNNIVERVVNMFEKYMSKEYINKFIWIFLFLGPFFDVITSFSLHFFESSMPIILIIKVLFLFFLFIIICKQKNKTTLLYCSSLALYFILFFVITYQTKGINAFFPELQNAFRTFYLPIALILIIPLFKNGFFKIKIKYLSYILIEYLILILIPLLTHTGFASYAYSKTGSIGWFYSTNEIGGIFALLCPFFILFLLKKSWWIKLLGIITYSYVLFSMGTKVPILAFLFTTTIILGHYFIEWIKLRKFKKIALSVIIVIVGISSTILIIPKTSFYKNIQIHLDFLEVKNINDLLTFKHIDHFIFSERLSFLLETKENYDNSDLVSHTLGIGITENYGKENVNTKMIEMDYYDIFYRYGIVGTILFFFPFLTIIWKRKYLLEELISISLIFALSFFSGHIIVAPSVSILVLCILLPKQEKEETV